MAPHHAIHRRSFFRSLLGETTALYDEVRGKPQRRLADIFELPDETLAQMKPMMLPDFEFIDEERRLSAKRRDTEAMLVLFEKDAAQVFLFNQFNGHTPIAEAATRLADQHGGSNAAAFVQAKALFLRLVRLGVCVPSNLIET